MVEKKGSPDPWEPQHHYHVGDTVVPTTIQPGQENIMFQCVGYLGQADSIEPTFDYLPASKTEDGHMEWTARDKNLDIPQLQYNEYFLIDESVVVQ